MQPPDQPAAAPTRVRVTCGSLEGELDLNVPCVLHQGADIAAHLHAYDTLSLAAAYILGNLQRCCAERDLDLNVNATQLCNIV